MARIVAAVKVGVGHDGAARDFIEGNIFGCQIGCTGHHHSVAHAAWVLQRPTQRLHSAQAAAHNGGERLDAQGVQQSGLRINPILHGDHRKISAVNFAGVRVKLHWPSGAKTRAKVVDANYKKLVGIDGFAGADHGVPPAFRPIFDSTCIVKVHPGHMMRGIECVADQYRVRLVGIKRAIGFKT